MVKNVPFDVGVGVFIDSDSRGRVRAIKGEKAGRRPILVYNPLNFPGYIQDLVPLLGMDLEPFHAFILAFPLD